MAEEQLVFTLEGGDVVIKLRPDLAPKHVEQITKLARDGFYDGLTFHRVIDNFMVLLATLRRPPPMSVIAPEFA